MQPPPLAEEAFRISSRCSIDFCEMMALQRVCESAAQIPKWETLHIATDSQTCLRWLSGEYQIRTTRIHRQMAFIYDMCRIWESVGRTVTIQWVKAHNQCSGNERADYLAKCGMYYLYNHFHHLRNWEGCSVRSIRKLCMRAAYGIEATAWADSRPELGLSFKLHEWDISRSGIFAEERKHLRYDEWSLILWFRCEHSGLNFHLSTKFNHPSGGNCPHCDTLETVNHFLTQCTKYAHLRLRLFRIAEKAYELFEMAQDERFPHDDPEKPRREHLAWKDDPEHYFLFPPKWMEISLRCDILKAVAKFARDTRRYTHFRE